MPNAPEEALRAWLEPGVALEILQREPRRYNLRSRTVQALVEPANTALAAMAQCIPSEQQFVLDALDHMCSGGKSPHDAHYSALVARLSRQLELFVLQALDALVPRGGTFRVRLWAADRPGTRMRWPSKERVDRSSRWRMSIRDRQDRADMISRKESNALNVEDTRIIEKRNYVIANVSSLARRVECHVLTVAIQIPRDECTRYARAGAEWTRFQVHERERRFLEGGEIGARVPDAAREIAVLVGCVHRNVAARDSELSALWIRITKVYRHGLPTIRDVVARRRGAAKQTEPAQ